MQLQELEQTDITSEDIRQSAIRIFDCPGPGIYLSLDVSLFAPETAQLICAVCKGQDSSDLELESVYTTR
jgi:hypothetical protein